jgi:hypothetical protein
MPSVLSRRLLLGAVLPLPAVRPSFASPDSRDALKAAFASEVGGSAAPPERARQALAQGREMLAHRLDRPQAFLLVDRAEDADGQWVHVAVGGLGASRWEIIGSSRTSTGRRGRFDHYLTPLGVFEHDGSILGWRAQGTPNAQGIRGLGTRGMRIWDFGWRAAQTGWLARPEMREIRLLVHATDPVHLEPRLGTPASKGCVRVSGRMNRFLDRHAILDAAYLAAAPSDRRIAALLPPDGVPSPLAGRFVAVVETA